MVRLGCVEPRIPPLEPIGGLGLPLLTTTAAAAAAAGDACPITPFSTPLAAAGARLFGGGLGPPTDPLTPEPDPGAELGLHCPTDANGIAGLAPSPFVTAVTPSPNTSLTSGVPRLGPSLPILLPKPVSFLGELNPSRVGERERSGVGTAGVPARTVVDGVLARARGVDVAGCWL